MVYKRLEEFPPKKNCKFCLSRRSDEIELGEIAHLNDIYCHYFCLLLANEVLQRGKDNQGILGFLPNDIKKEILRGKKIACDYCKKNGATIQCSEKKCKSKFHLPCGLKKNSLHQFFGNFRSFCSSHRPEQKIPSKVLATERNCVLCQNQLQRTTSYIWPECCMPSALIHRRCLQKMALEHGYSFKCPLCNDSKQFLEQSKRLGIYIPEQEPSWERENGAFEDLLDRRIACELGTNCLCDNGTSFSRIGTKWKLERCNLCGSSGIHLACSTEWVPGSGFAMPWSCEVCTSATRNPPNEATVSDSGPDSYDEEMEYEVDVETIDDDDEDLRPVHIDSYIQPRETMHLIPEPQPYTLEPSPSLDFLRTSVPIIIKDSDDELEGHDEVEVLSISSEEEDPAPIRRRLLRSGNVPRPIVLRAVPESNRVATYLVRATAPQVSLMGVAALFASLLGLLACQSR